MKKFQNHILFVILHHFIGRRYVRRLTRTGKVFRHVHKIQRHQHSKMKKVIFLGLGYIGLPTAAIAAHHGYDVVGVDVNPSVVETINRGEIHIVEPELDKVVKEYPNPRQPTHSSLSFPPLSSKTTVPIPHTSNRRHARLSRF